MARYRKKPVVIEAYCYNQRPENYRPDWFQDRVTRNEIITYEDHADIPTLEGTMRADLGDWIIKGVKGEIYPCKPDIFEATYEAVEAEPAQFEGTNAEAQAQLNNFMRQSLDRISKHTP